MYEDDLKAFENDLKNLDKQIERTKEIIKKLKTQIALMPYERRLIILLDMRNDVLIQIKKLEEQKND